MSCAVLLLCLALIGTATSESTNETNAADEIPSLPKEDKDTGVKPFVIDDGNSTGIKFPENDDNDPDADLDRADSQTTFKFSPADAKTVKQGSELPDDAVEGDDSNDDTSDIIQELTSLMNAEVKLMTNDSDTSVTKIKNEDDDSEEDGEDDDIEEEEETEDSKPEESQIKRQDKPIFNQNKAFNSEFDQTNRKGEMSAPPSNVYVTVDGQPGDSNSENDNSPLLQLTQGGYRPPFVFNRESPRVRAQSATQQSETIENPTENVNNNQQFRPQISPQVSYAEPFQSQFGFGSALGLRNPFISPDSFVNSNGMVHQPVHNGFFNVPPAGFTDFTGTNFQTPFSSSNDDGFQVLPRTPSGIPLFQTPSEHVAHHPGFMVQNQHFPQTQFLATDPTKPTSTLYQTTGFVNHPGAENANAPRPDYSPFYRNSLPNNLQFQENPFAPPRSAASILYSPMMPFQPNFPNRPQYSPQYPEPNHQVQVQSTAPEEGQSTDLDKITEGETTKTEEQVNASPNKEDFLSVPFGARIQKQNSPEPQRVFPPQADVYMRYPVKDAGYATEESLPIQNTTTETEKKNEYPSPRQMFSLFPSPGQFGDPYRNALNSIQRGFSTESNSRSTGNNNRTNQAEPEKLPPSIPFPFSQPAMTRPIPGYPESRNPNPPLMRPPTFFRTVDSTVADPFDQLGMFHDRFPVPLKKDSQSKETPVLPACVHGQANASVCFEDPEYPKRDVLFALNSDPYLMDRFSTPDQQLDTISLIEQDRMEHPESPDNYICSSRIRYGFPLRAKNVDGQWKVIINVEKDAEQGRFGQPVRLEVCKGAGEPCNFTQVKTACVQKYNLHRLFAWSPEEGIHYDVFKLPVACSCQVIGVEA